MTIFGLTGGIACGKSTVTKTFRKHLIPMIDADIVARQVVEPGTIGLKSLVETFGKEYLQEDGTLDRIKLGALVFSTPGALSQINSIMMPLIQAESDKQLSFCQGDLAGYDAALIIEMGNAAKFRPLIVVSCPADTQIARLMSRNNLTRAEAVTRIETQMPVSEKIKLADFVIDTSGTIENSILQTEKIINHLQRMM